MYLLDYDFFFMLIFYHAFLKLKVVKRIFSYLSLCYFKRFGAILHHSGYVRWEFVKYTICPSVDFLT